MSYYAPEDDYIAHDFGVDLDEVHLDDVRMVDTTDFSDPQAPDLHPDQCARTGHEPARLVSTQVRYGTGQEVSRIYECPCSSYQQKFFPNGSSDPKLPVQS